MYRENWKGITLTPYALVKHWTLLGEYVKDVPVPHDCNKDGHGMIDLDVIDKCRFCGLEISKKTS